MFVKDIINVTSGKLISGNKDLFIDSFSIDSRTINNGELYISINGDNFNGNDFINDAFDKGAYGVIYQGVIDYDLIKKFYDRIFINVEDSVKALQDMAKYKRSLYNIPVVSITGSVGKTSTKDLVRSVMKEKYNVLSTKGNLNNHIGLPLTLLGLKDHDAMCIEVGMNHKGELSLLTDILKPTVAIITNVGTAHIGNLGSRENILNAKLELLEGLSSDGIVIINNDNDLLNKWYKEQNSYKVLSYGIKNKSDLNATNIKYDLNETIFDVLVDGSKENINIKVPGEHFVYNSLCAILAGKLLNIDNQSIKKGILNFELSKGRMEIRRHNDITLLVDCYNANYDSMKAALEVLGKYKNRKIAVLGDMLELGEYSVDLHKKVGESVKLNNIDILVTVGELSKNIASSFGNDNVYVCNSNEEAISILNKILKKDDVVLFKASNSMKFIEIVEKM